MMTIIQVLVFQSPEKAKQLGPAVWAAFQEIENFYNHDQQRLVCRRLVFDPGQDEPFRSELGSCNDNTAGTSAESFWVSARGRYHRTIDQNRLVALMREKLPTQERELPMVVITDSEITPPPDWRYIIWDNADDNCLVVSIAPTDPLFWREQISPRRIAVIKHRVRTAGLSATGELLGLRFCKNSSCFLFDDVESTEMLDSMLILGKEHKIPGLEGLGFSPRPRDPFGVQRIQRGLLTPEDWAKDKSLEEEWDTNE